MFRTSRSKIEAIFREVGYKQGQARVMAMMVKDAAKAKRISDQIVLGKKEGVFKTLGIQRPLICIKEAIQYDSSDPDSGIMEWYLSYEETGELPCVSAGKPNHLKLVSK